MEQLILHLVGDYVTQSHWMANEKTRSSVAAGVHALVYTGPFLLLGPSDTAFAAILGTHFLIDRFRLARYVCWAKNLVAPVTFCVEPRWSPIAGDISQRWIEPGAYHVPWRECRATGYPPDCPAWLAVWLLIAADNTLHLAINYAALRWL